MSKYVPEIKKAQLVEKDCSDHLFCGMPYLVPVLSLIWKTHWIPGPMPYLETPVKMNVAKRVKTPSGEEVTLKIEGRFIFQI